MEIREDFCGICAAIPIALTGLGASTYVASGAEYKTQRTFTVIGCAFAIIVSIYFLMKYSDCESCKA